MLSDVLNLMSICYIVNGSIVVCAFHSYKISHVGVEVFVVRLLLVM